MEIASYAEQSANVIRLSTQSKVRYTPLTNRHSDDELRAIAKEINDFKIMIMKKHHISVLDLKRLAKFMGAKSAEQMPDLVQDDQGTIYDANGTRIVDIVDKDKSP